jgi:UDP-N-acetyl-D-galactosamine dehydrogenase
VVDIIRELKDYGLSVQVCDPLADPKEALKEYGVTLTAPEQLKPAVAVVAAVAHRSYREWSPERVGAIMGQNPVLIDVKGLYDSREMAAAGIRVWSL